MFTLRIKDLHAATILGVYDWEKQAPRKVILNIEMDVAATDAAQTDDLKDAVDYAVVETRVLQLLDKNSWQLLEKLVVEVGNLILSLDSRITRVYVEVDKPGALRESRSVSVSAELCR
ncbi:MAG: dihydroneopterin aldolase [Rickettsiales bacterium]|nr:dihydroneopterin aldolase [Rickettsiales bacterium]